MYWAAILDFSIEYLSNIKSDHSITFLDSYHIYFDTKIIEIDGLLTDLWQIQDFPHFWRPSWIFSQTRWISDGHPRSLHCLWHILTYYDG